MSETIYPNLATFPGYQPPEVGAVILVSRGAGQADDMRVVSVNPGEEGAWTLECEPVAAPAEGCA